MTDTAPETTDWPTPAKVVFILWSRDLYSNDKTVEGATLDEEVAKEWLRIHNEIIKDRGVASHSMSFSYEPIRLAASVPDIKVASDEAHVAAEVARTKALLEMLSPEARLALNMQ